MRSISPDWLRPFVFCWLAAARPTNPRRAEASATSPKPRPWPEQVELGGRRQIASFQTRHFSRPNKSQMNQKFIIFLWLIFFCGPWTCENVAKSEQAVAAGSDLTLLHFPRTFCSISENRANPQRGDCYSKGRGGGGPQIPPQIFMYKYNTRNKRSTNGESDFHAKIRRRLLLFAATLRRWFSNNTFTPTWQRWLPCANYSYFGGDLDSGFHCNRMTSPTLFNMQMRWCNQLLIGARVARGCGGVRGWHLIAH